MAPSRNRAAQEDSMPAPPAKEPSKAATGSKVRKSAANSANAATSNTGTAGSGKGSKEGAGGGANEAPTIPWTQESLAVLHEYRHVYRLEAAASFHTALNQAVLSTSAIGRHSPTMVRKAEQRKVGKDALALAVRKHFNDLAVNEGDVVIEFLYKVHMKDEAFKLRFGPRRR